MRPQSIRIFEALYLLSIAIGLLVTIITWDDMLANIMSDPQASALGEGFAQGSMMVGVAIGIGFPLLLWYFVARRGSNLARWVLVAFTLIGLAFSGLSLAGADAPQGLSLASVLSTSLLQIGALVMLFRPDAAAWFNRTTAG